MSNTKIKDLLNKYNFILVKQHINKIENFNFLELIIMDKNLQNVSIKKISEFHKEIKNLDEIQSIWPNNGGLQVISAGRDYKFVDLNILQQLSTQKINIKLYLKNGDKVSGLIKIDNIQDNQLQIIYNNQIINILLKNIKYFNVYRSKDE